MSDLSTVKSQILSALRHPEAEEGLYFRNFYHLHEEDERPQVDAPEEDILEALHELIRDGHVATVDDGPEIIFTLSSAIT